MRKYILVLAVCISQSPGQQQWQSMGLGYEKITTIAVDPQDPDIIYAGSYSVFTDTFGLGGIFKSTNGGVSWDTVAVPASVSRIVIHPSNTNILYAALNSANFMRPGIAKSTDAGQSWFYADSGILIQVPADFQGIAIDPQHPETLYCGEGGNFPRTLWKTTTGGMYWFPSDSGGMNDNTTGGHILIDPESTSVVYASTSGLSGSVWKTTNSGALWFNLGIPWNEEGVAVFEMDPHDPATLYAEASQLAKTTDSGQSWRLMTYDSVGLPSAACIAFHPDTINLWYGGSGNDVYVSRNGGNRWELMNPPIQGLNGYIRVLAIAPDGGALYAGCWGATYADGSGVYKYVFPPTGVPVREDIPKSLRLHQNYPNPFNPVTMIEFDIRTASEVLLKIYDVLSREVATLVTGSKPPGRYRVTWNGAGMGSGMYFACLSAGNLTQTIKLVLVR